VFDRDRESVCDRMCSYERTCVQVFVCVLVSM